MGELNDEVIQGWARISEAGDTPARFFIESGYERICICGTSDDGMQLHKELESRGVPVKGVVQKLEALSGYFDVNTFERITDFSIFDIIIVTDVSRYEEIRSELGAQTTADMISLGGIIACMCDILDIYGKMSNHTARAGARLYFARYPRMWELDRFTNYDLTLQSFHSQLTIDFMKTNPKHLEVVLGDHPRFSAEYVRSVFTCPPIIKKAGVIMHSDLQSEFINVVNGVRMTADPPERADRSVHILGQCVAYGFGTDDGRTIASFLQRRINASPSMASYRVLNYGVWGCDERVEYWKKIRSLPLERGDIVILIEPFYRLLLSRRAYRFFEKECARLGITYCDLYEVINNRPEGLEVFLDCHHVGPAGFELIAGKLYEACAADLSAPLDTFVPAAETDRPETANDAIHDRSIEEISGFGEYLQMLREMREDAGRIGAVVVNCNPFTLGHQYLIRSAAAQVDLLYIFVVEEDKSFFPFRDRFMLVQAGVANFGNVRVIPSGRFIISALTFPEYFSKDDPDSVAIDPSRDVELFGGYIAPALGISVRFAGHEPFCTYTRQYNEAMRTILPRFGVRFQELTRIESDSEAISASKVRRLLKSEDFEAIRCIVPLSTYEYLVAEFGGSSMRKVA